MITVTIAEKIASINKPGFVTLEDNINYILTEANAKGKGKISGDTRANGRSDIVVWWGRETPRAIVEVKNGVNVYAKIHQDLKRINDVLKRKSELSELEFGLIAFFISNSYKTNARYKLQKQIDNIFEYAGKEIVAPLIIEKYQSDIIVMDETEAYASVVLLLRR